MARRFLSSHSHFSPRNIFPPLLRNISHFLGEPTVFSGRSFGVAAHVVLLGPCERIGGHIARLLFIWTLPPSGARGYAEHFGFREMTWPCSHPACWNVILDWCPHRQPVVFCKWIDGHIALPPFFCWAPPPPGARGDAEHLGFCGIDAHIVPLGAFLAFPCLSQIFVYNHVEPRA